MDIQQALDVLNIEISNRDKVTDVLKLARNILQENFVSEFTQQETYRKLVEDRTAELVQTRKIHAEEVKQITNELNSKKAEIETKANEITQITDELTAEKEKTAILQSEVTALTELNRPKEPVKNLPDGTPVQELPVEEPIV